MIKGKGAKEKVGELRKRCNEPLRTDNSINQNNVGDIQRINSNKEQTEAREII